MTPKHRRPKGFLNMQESISLLHFIEMSRGRKMPRSILEQYFEDHQTSEVSGLPATVVHHIYGKWCDELKTNPLNFCSLCDLPEVKEHYMAEFTDVQEMANKIFNAKIKQHGQAFIDFSDRIGHKTWVNRS